MPKPVIPTNALAAGNSCFTNSPVQKLKNSAFAEFWDSTPEFYGGILFWLLEYRIVFIHNYDNVLFSSVILLQPSQDVSTRFARST